MIKHRNNKSYYGACKKTRRTLRMVEVVRLEEHSVSQADAGCECTEKSQHQEGAKRTMQETVREDRRVGPLRAQQFINYELNHGNPPARHTATRIVSCRRPLSCSSTLPSDWHEQWHHTNTTHSPYRGFGRRCNRLQQETNLALPICRA